jgi:hypothetical protein
VPSGTGGFVQFVPGKSERVEIAKALHVLPVWRWQGWHAFALADCHATEVVRPTIFPPPQDHKPPDTRDGVRHGDLTDNNEGK